MWWRCTWVGKFVAPGDDKVAVLIMSYEFVSFGKSEVATYSVLFVQNLRCITSFTSTQ
jgi:hypothetical protein